MEEFVPIYATTDGEVRDPPPTTAELTPEEAETHPQVQEVIEDADRLIEKAKKEAQRRVEKMADEAEQEKQEVVEIKRQHAERYFDNAIETKGNQLREYRRRLEQGKEMKGVIGRTESELEDLREQRKREFEHLREGESVLPKTNDLINAAVVVPWQ